MLFRSARAPDDLTALLEALGANGHAYAWSPDANAFLPVSDLSPGLPILVFLRTRPARSAAATRLHLILPDEDFAFRPVPGWHLRAAIQENDFRVEGGQAPAHILHADRSLPAPGAVFQANAPAWLFFP